MEWEHKMPPTHTHTPASQFFTFPHIFSLLCINVHKNWERLIHKWTEGEKSAMGRNWKQILFSIIWYLIPWRWSGVQKSDPVFSPLAVGCHIDPSASYICQTIVTDFGGQLSLSRTLLVHGCKWKCLASNKVSLDLTRFHFIFSLFVKWVAALNTQLLGLYLLVIKTPNISDSDNITEDPHDFVYMCV